VQPRLCETKEHDVVRQRSTRAQQADQTPERRKASRDSSEGETQGGYV
jgi:hypothetical protein